MFCVCRWVRLSSVKCIIFNAISGANLLRLSSSMLMYMLVRVLLMLSCWL